MSASSDLALGEIAYDGYHALDADYIPFGDLSEDERWRWAQAACNARDAWVKPGGLNVKYWRESTRTAHAYLRMTPIEEVLP